MNAKEERIASLRLEFRRIASLQKEAFTALEKNEITQEEFQRRWEAIQRQEKGLDTVVV